ncbi:hypothetical protein AAG570_004415 [Ranatra chinensis]|uniref:PPM-type phosphatase domain-containing protein n=1 Tax=Ranatra chinensis TaxID=642074 RepID=A0ABD0Y1M1_9HEMI
MGEKEPIESFDTNQLPSNNPMEDKRAEARCTLSGGLLFGVFDGHGGPRCAEIVSNRLLSYIAASLLPHSTLNEYLASSDGKKGPMDFIEHYNENDYRISEREASVYAKSFKTYVVQLASRKQPFTSVEDALKFSFLKLDNDLSREVLEEEDPVLKARALGAALSGSVGCVALVDGADLHIAAVGDCGAVLGVTSGHKSWAAKSLTAQHTAQNGQEVMRVLREHPGEEKESLIRDGRLLGRLQPLRAFGDFRYDSSRIKVITFHLLKWLTKVCLPPLKDAHTPPYLTARPDVTYHRLRPHDKFLVIASDGLWEMASPLEVVRLIGNHLSSRVFLGPFSVPHKNERVRRVESKVQRSRRGDVEVETTDVNSATHLIRTILGSGAGKGFTTVNLSLMLSLPQDIVRRFRDDITITVVFFNTSYLTKRSSSK